MCNHPSRPNRRAVLAVLSALPAMGLPRRLWASAPEAGPVDLPAPGPRDTCPVCGMFVAKYPDWIATVVYADGHAEHFDGAKDFFKYLAELEKYAPGRALSDITGMGVTEYYGVSRIDARRARYVLGSDVLGPMGHELVPLASDADAADYLKDHKGVRQISFDEVTLDLLIALDQGRFE